MFAAKCIFNWLCWSICCTISIRRAISVGNRASWQSSSPNFKFYTNRSYARSPACSSESVYIVNSDEVSCCWAVIIRGFCVLTSKNLNWICERLGICERYFAEVSLSMKELSTQSKI